MSLEEKFKENSHLLRLTSSMKKKILQNLSWSGKYIVAWELSTITSILPRNDLYCLCLHPLHIFSIESSLAVRCSLSSLLFDNGIEELWFCHPKGTHETCICCGCWIVKEFRKSQGIVWKIFSGDISFSV